MPQKEHGGGPKTPEGKQRSSMNALRHGFAARTIVLSTEDPAEFQAIIDDYLHDFAPHTSVEKDLVEELAVCRWRLQRAWSIETEMFEVTMSRKFDEVAAEYGTPMNKTRSALAFMSMADDDKAFALLNRYETRLTRRFHQILHELKTLKNQRVKENCETNSPIKPKLAVVPKPTPKGSPEVPEIHPNIPKQTNNEPKECKGD